MNKRLPKKKRGGRRNSYPKFKKPNIEEEIQENDWSSWKNSDLLIFYIIL